MTIRRFDLSGLKLICLFALSLILFLTPPHSTAATAATSFTGVPAAAETSDVTETEEMENTLQFRPVVRVSLQQPFKDSLRFSPMLLFILSLLCSAFLALSFMDIRPIISRRLKRIMLYPVKFTSRFVA
ncbi:hypothetical protein AWM70_15025 [Paenibacillus yonginensis]|uniref:Transmembrane protein n=1 Tax=Paenibacillus yonginensis TaxID=1462996 RepID=A0A1B1N2V6_9BACL|nr:hypothetical protein [Paenibacillus yonginensis]ANS75750.1 hypothetical protein AWM70_15025 [Paenibacillus yonginensis]